MYWTAEPPSTGTIKYTGCARVAVGPVCDLKPATRLTFWIPGGPHDQLEVKLDGRPLRVATATASGGVRFELSGLEPGLLTLRARDDATPHRLRLLLQTYEQVEVPDEIRSAATPEAFRRFERWADAHPGREGITAYFKLVSAASKLDDQERMLDYLARASQLAAASGEWSLESKARFARSFRLAFSFFRAGEAERELERLSRLSDDVADIGAYIPYYRAVIWAATGDVSRAIAEFRRVEPLADAVGMDLLVHIVRSQRAQFDWQLGHYHAALTKLREVLAWAAANGEHCTEAEAASNVGWVLILMKDRGVGDGQSPEGALRRALKLYNSSCSKPAQRAVLYLNLAFAALQTGRPTEAEQWLQQARGDELAARNRPWLDETRARIELARGDLAAAQAAAASMIDAARQVAGTNHLFRAYALSADVLTRLHRFDEALVARERAEDALDQLAVSVPLVGARHSFLTVREDNILGLASLFISKQRPADAMGAIRRARSRSLGWARVSQGLARLSLHDRAKWNGIVGEYRKLRTDLDREVEDDWKRSAKELKTVRLRREAREGRLAGLLAEALSVLQAEPKKPSNDPYTLHLSWIRLRSGVVMLGQLGDDGFSVPWPENASVLPAKVGRRIERADRVVLHPYGEFRGHPLHMLTWQGRPIAAQVETVYSLDLPSVGDATPPEVALVVIDPAAELEHGREEVKGVTAALHREKARVDEIAGDVAEVRARLGGVDWFHFGGHGRWSPEDPMAGGLALADGARLALGDILAAPQVPATVVLTSCEAGRGAGRGGEAFGLAHAFLVAGARVVVAPDREVTDEEAARFSLAFYGVPGNAVTRYRSAVEALGREASAFRVFVP